MSNESNTFYMGKFMAFDIAEYEATHPFTNGDRTFIQKNLIPSETITESIRTEE